MTKISEQFENIIIWVMLLACFLTLLGFYIYQQNQISNLQDQFDKSELKKLDAEKPDQWVLELSINGVDWADSQFLNPEFFQYVKFVRQRNVMSGWCEIKSICKKGRPK